MNPPPRPVLPLFSSSDFDRFMSILFLLPLALLPIRVFMGEIPLSSGCTDQAATPRHKIPKRQDIQLDPTKPPTRPKYFHTAPGSPCLSKQFPISLTAGSIPETRACDRQNVYGAWPRVSSTTNLDQDKKGKKNIKRGQVPWRYRAESQPQQPCPESRRRRTNPTLHRVGPWANDHGAGGGKPQCDLDNIERRRRRWCGRG
ncbi:hypothetical protein B0T18DRAFT_212039 [Schizothecium vesticola]|uniref:Uncharacterized protein n=1 Tax=Schizothecium vesticola TaxID=314040 RepID=A0AA40EJM7_9PEZI|nr:hypothetical protein B0T18DRAFT_212039 [Schizothecium vesticola]